MDGRRQKNERRRLSKKVPLGLKLVDVQIFRCLVATVSKADDSFRVLTVVLQTKN